MGTHCRMCIMRVNYVSQERGSDMDFEDLERGDSVDTLFALLLLVPSYLLAGWAICLVWSWFAVPALGVAGISLRNAIGLLVLVQMLRGGRGRSEEKPLSLIGLEDIMGWLVMVGMAYIVHLF